MEFNTQEPYLIAEIGINHNGDLQLAKKLIDAAHGCSWDCVKFQKRNPDVCVPENQKGKIKETPWGTMTYLEYKNKIEFGKEEYDYIQAYCEEKPLEWSASVWDVDSLHFMLGYNISFIKIPSAKITDYTLLKEATVAGVPLVVSTGMSTFKEIDEAVKILKKGKSSFMLMHANSAYPAQLNELNLKVIRTLKERYKCPIGYSGHEYNVEPTVYAAVLGARVIERHITLDHAMWGTDQASSLELMGMDILRKRIKDINAILGDGVKRITLREALVLEKLRG